MSDLGARAGDVLERIWRQAPLVHLVTNFVTMNRVADALSALGARPVMALAREEVAEIASSARAVVLNLGTPTPERVQALQLAGQAANARGIPVVFDPVGVGASEFRTAACAELLSTVKIAVLRANRGEIAALAGQSHAVSGVDSAFGGDVAVVAQAVAQRWQTVVAVTGEIDRVQLGERVVLIHNGHAALRKLTGAGDMVDALCGACLAVETDPFMAACSALVYMGVAAERAGAQAGGPASFSVKLIDELAALNMDILVQGTRYEYIEAS